MTTATRISETVGDGILKAVEVGQRITLDAVSATVATIEGVLPERALAPFTPMISPKDIVDTGFRFAERLLESQKAFLGDLVDVTMPAGTSPAKGSAAS